MTVINLKSQLKLTYTASANGAPPSTGEQLYYVGRARVGEPVKGWKRIIDNNGNATSPTEASDIVSQQMVSSQMTFQTAVPPVTDRGYFSGNYFLGYRSFTVDAALVSYLDNQARIKALSKLRSGFNASTFFGELREALTMIRNPALAARKHITTQVTTAKRLRTAARTVKAYRKAIAGTWLEFQFGWKPLAGDIYNAVESYNDTVSQPQLVPFKGTIRQTVSTPRVRFDQSNPYYPFHVDLYGSSKTEYAVSYQGKARLGHGLKPSNFNFGATMPDFVPTAWELMPWSFVVDYFVNIGGVLNSGATLSLVDFSYISGTHRAVNLQNIDLWWSSNNLGISVNGTPGRASWLQKNIKRTAPVSFPMPSLQMSKGLNLTQGLNLAALAETALKDRNYRR